MTKEEVKQLLEESFSQIIEGWIPPADFDVNLANEKLDELAEQLSN